MRTFSAVTIASREQRGGRGQRLGGGAALADPAAVLVAGGLLELGEPLEAERLREAHDRARGRVGPAGQLLGGLEGGFVEVVDDVLRDVLLRSAEVVEARPDISRKRLVTVVGLGTCRRSR
jgi:hypothetical protein